MRFLIALLALASIGAYGQAVYTPPTPATAAVPGKMVATAGSGATGTSCTFAGNAVPATAVIVNCTLGTQVLISSVTVPISSSIAVTLQINSGAGLTTANTVMISASPAPSGITISAAVNGGTAVTGTF